jgi:hypothetical protein
MAMDVNVLEHAPERPALAKLSLEEQVRVFMLSFGEQPEIGPGPLRQANAPRMRGRAESCQQ